MKKICTLIIVALCMLSLTLEARTPQEASAIASAFIQARNETTPVKRLQRAAAATTVTAPVELAHTQYQVDNTTPAVFVFNSTSEGFVLVSAADNARAVLGYSDEGTFDANNIPENMQFWLQMYADEMRREGVVSDQGEKAMRRKVIRREAEAESYPTISPILGNTVWGQGTPFNNMCPLLNGQRTVAGCVATALSQIMYAHKYPTRGTGSHSYTTETMKLSASANFGNTTYDWANMIPDYNGTYTATQANAVATLTYHVGVAANMDYTLDGSGAVSAHALIALTDHFGYDKGIQTLPKDYMNEDYVLSTIASDLQAGKPVYVGGLTVDQEGHAFICDGMKSDGYLHINWGWYGIANGYFALSALAPDTQGTGGSATNLAFTEQVTIYTGIQPNAGGQAMPLITIDKLVRTSGDVISKTTPVAFSLEQFTSSGMATAEGMLTYYIYRNDQLVSQVEVGTFELAPGYYYTSPIQIKEVLPATLASGEYELEIRYVDYAGKNHPILVKGLGQVRIPFTVTATQLEFDPTPEAEIQLRDFTNADMSHCFNTDTWNIDLFSRHFWNETPSEQEVLIRCKIHNNSSTSVTGSYTTEDGTIDADVLYAVGYANACYQYTPTKLHLTFVPAANEQMLVHYYMEVNGQVIQGTYTATPDWYDQDDEYYYYKEDYTYELTSTLSASQALRLTSALSHTELTQMSYFVQGTISHMRNTPAEIVQYRSARFDISDDGSTNNQFYCYNTRWLNNTDFTTGHEVALGDKVVILGPVQNYNGNTPEIKGYIYQHTDAAGNLTDIDNISTLEVIAIYDLMGRQWSTTDHLPAGIYIIHTNEGVTTIYID